MTSKLTPRKHNQTVGSLLGRYYRFLKQPIYSVNVPPQQHPLEDTLRQGILYVLISSLLGYILGFLYERIATGHAVADMADQPWILFFSGVFLIPLIEEIMFRLPLRYTPTNLTFSACVWLLLILGLLSSINAISVGSGFLLLCLAISGCLFFGVWLNQNIPAKRIHKFYEKNIKFFFYISSIIFGLIHISNYQLKHVIYLPFIPLFVIPQAIAGTQLAFIRLRYGFWWSVFSHAFINCIFIVEMLLPQSKFSMLRMAVFFLCLIVVINMVVEWCAETKAG